MPAPDAATLIDDVATRHVGDIDDDHVAARTDAVGQYSEHLDVERLRRGAR